MFACGWPRFDLGERRAERPKESSSNCRALLSRRMARLPTSKKVFDVGGETWANPHGTSRQDELTQCEPGEPVRLLLEANNPDDPGAVLVVSDRGVRLGYLQRGDAAVIGPIIGGGRPFAAKLHRLTGGVPDAPSYGAQISIVWDGRTPLPHVLLDEEQISYRTGTHANQGFEHRVVDRLRGKSRSGCAGVLTICVLTATALVQLT